jgi:hypothetical protein
MNVNEYYTLVWSVNKFHYGIYTYKECKSQTIYTHNTGKDLALFFLILKKKCEH